MGTRANLLLLQKSCETSLVGPRRLSLYFIRRAIAIKLALAAVLAFKLGQVLSLCKIVDGGRLGPSGLCCLFADLLLGFVFSEVFHELLVDLLRSNCRFLHRLDSSLHVGKFRGRHVVVLEHRLDV